MNRNVKQAAHQLGKAITSAVKADETSVDEAILYYYMTKEIGRVISKYAIRFSDLHKKEVASGVESTESDKRKSNRDQYSTSSAEIQVIPWSELDTDAKAILSDLFRGGEQL